MKSVTVFSHRAFDEFCSLNRINDNNVMGRYGNNAFISITCSESAYADLGERIMSKHYFNEQHGNVLNIEFDDVDEDMEYEGVQWKAITPSQAETIVNFIESNLEKSFFVHCFAGKSRSQAVCHFIARHYGDRFDTYNNINDTPNVKVLSELDNAYDRIHSIDKEQIYNELFSK